MKKIELLAFHNILWSHYTGIVLSELNAIVHENGGKFKVVHIASTQSSRHGIGNEENKYHRYEYDLLHKGSLEEFGPLAQLRKGLPHLFRSHCKYVMVFGYDLPLYMAVILMAPLVGKKLIVVADSTEADRKRVFIKEKLKSFLLRFASIVLCYGDAHRRYLKKLGVPERRIFLRVQATDNDEIRQLFLAQRQQQVQNKPHTRTFIFVGRLIPEKNLFTLLNAFQMLKSDWCLQIVGGGELLNQLQNHCEQQNIDNVVFMGAKPLAEVVKLIAAADVMVLPSISETWGLVINEAMICEKPVIVSTNCGCAGDLVDEGKNGFAFEATNTEQLSALMKRFTNNEVDMKAMGQRSYEIIRNFTPEKAASQIFAAISSIT